MCWKNIFPSKSIYAQTENGILYNGNVLEILKKLPDGSIDCIVTSPPYWGLRWYGEKANAIWSGDPNCKHEWNYVENKLNLASPDKSLLCGDRSVNPKAKKLNNIKREGFCLKCGAWYGQLGLEPTLDMFLEHMLQITAELKRVLKSTGLMFWNHGDSYGGSNCGKNDYRNQTSISKPELYTKQAPQAKLTPKCMVMQNYRLVLRMIDEQEWILRNIIIWHKTNHLPESVKDRFTRSYEPIFMLTKNPKYWFDLDAVRVPHSNSSYQRAKHKWQHSSRNNFATPPNTSARWNVKKLKYNFEIGKNPGDVWQIAAGGFSAKKLGIESTDHFAVFPEKLITPMIKAGCMENGIVLDPFIGSGTTAIVAEKLKRNWIGIEINEDYCEIAKQRVLYETKQLALL